MVYCGKPSQACEQCKARQIRCDFKLVCNQCKRRKLKCSGPRDRTELVFRDQSQEVSQKVLARTPPRHLALSITDRARIAFFSQYVSGNAKTFEYLSSWDPKTSGSLLAPIQAVSLAYFSNQEHSREIMLLAQQNYVEAIQALNNSLQNHISAIQDWTLVAILLFDLYEKMTNTSQTRESWTKHVEGAMALVKLRGDGQFQSALGLRMFLQLSSTILIGCVQYDVQVPAAFIEHRMNSMKYFDITDPKWRFSGAVIKYIDLRVRIREGRLSKRGMLAAAELLEQELYTITTEMPGTWKYETIELRKSLEGVYGGEIHIYPNHIMAHTWSNIRILRILLNEIVLEGTTGKLHVSNIQYPNSRLDTGRESPEATTVGLLEEICASVPQYTQLPRFLHSQSQQGLPESKPTMKRSFTAFESARCYSLIYPLYVTGQCSVCPEPMRLWIINRLDFLATKVGISRASVVSDLLKRRQKINPWIVYARIGSYSFSA